MWYNFIHGSCQVNEEQGHFYLEVMTTESASFDFGLLSAKGDSTELASPEFKLSKSKAIALKGNLEA